MARHHFCTLADEIGHVRSERAELTDTLATLCRERAPAAVIAATNKRLQAANQRLKELELEQAKQDAKGGGTRHVLGQPIKWAKSSLPPHSRGRW